MNVPDYSYAETEEGRPLSADTSVWFSYGDAGKAVYYGVFELVFAERKYIMVYYGNEILKDAEVLVTSY